jgi:hypothetical protein
MSLDVGQVRSLHWLECRWRRILSSVLSLAVVKVVCRIGQHYECSRSSEKSSLLKVMQLSTPVGSETAPLLELVCGSFEKKNFLPHAAQAVRPGGLKLLVFSAVID